MMTRTGLAVLLLVALAAGLCAAAEVPPPPAAGVPFVDLLSGRDYPLSLTLKDLDNTWRVFTVVGGEDSSGALGAIYGVPAKTYFTKGQTVTAVGRQQILLAYSPQLKPLGLSALMAGRGGELPRLAADTPLRLALLNVASLSMVSDIRVFDREAEIAAYNSSAQGLQAMVSSRTTSVEEQPEEGTPLANLKNVALAAVMYATDYDKYPPMKTPQAFRSALTEYVKNAVVFKDPTTGAFFALNAGLSEKSTSSVADASKAVLAYQEKADKDGKRGVAYADGHVATVTETEWSAVKKASGLK